MTSRLPDYLAHMLEAARLATSYVEGFSKEAFISDRRTQQAVMMNVVVLGEAAAKINAEHADFVAEHADIPWKAMRGMRNRVAHGYFDVDLDVVWETVQFALPRLASQLEPLVNVLPPK